MRIRTGHSFKLAAGHLADVASRIEEIGWKVAPISDRCSEYGFVDFTKICAKKGLRPIYGVELAVCPDKSDGKRPTDYWTFFAKDNLRSLSDLIWTATSNVMAKKQEPFLTYDEALAAGGVIKITGEKALFDFFSPQQDLFVGLSPSCSKGYVRAAITHGHKFIATSDNFYPRQDDKEFYRVLIGRNANTQTWPMHILSDDEWRDAVARVADPYLVAGALANWDGATATCQAVMEKAEILIAEKPKTLRLMCQEGAERLGLDIADDPYAARLDRELAMIAEKKFEDYFYILADMIQYARKIMVVGPARGSSCGSLVCFLLEITTVDPIPHKLVFERFIDVTRADLPDVDVDFSDTRRHLVFEYVEEKYGRDRVARLGSVGSYQAKSALNQAGASLKVPSWRIDKLSDTIIKRLAGDSRAELTIQDTLTETAPGIELIREYPEMAVVSKMEGHPTSAGQHAAGIVLTERSIKDYIAIDARTGSVMADKKDAEELNLLKIDALGLTQLSIFERTMELIGVKPVSGWLEKIPLDDQAAFDVLNKKHFGGIFQFIGSSCQSLCKQITIESLADIINLTALARPGPLSSGGAERWVKLRNGEDEVTYEHEMLRPYLESTYGIPIFQEQAMRIGKELGDLSWEEVSELRRAMSRSLGKEFFSQFGDKFKPAIIEKGMPPEIAERFWDNLCEFGAMSFNAAHSVAYGHISYWCCWFKAHHPVEFAAATLDAEGDPLKQVQLLRELAEEGIRYVPVDPEHSTDRWGIVKESGVKHLVGPLTQIKGIGPVACRTIIEERRRGSDLALVRPSIAKKLVDPKTAIDSLYPIGDRIEQLRPERPPEAIKVADIVPGMRGVVELYVLIERIAPSDENALAKLAKRGGNKVTGPSMSLNVFASDDTDEILCRVDRMLYDTVGVPIVSRGGAGKALYRFVGTVPRSFRMLAVTSAEYLGTLAAESPTAARSLDEEFVV